MTEPRTRRSRTIIRLRGLIADERGAAAPIMTLAAVVVFGLISIGFGGGLRAAMGSMQSQKVNTALAAQLSEFASKQATLGYPTVSALPPTSTVTVSIGGADVEAVQTIVVDEDAKTAEITLRAGKFADGHFTDPDTCSEAPTNCLSATDVATPTLSQTIPTVAGVDDITGANSIPEDAQSRWVDVAAGPTTTVAIAEDGTLWAWGLNANGEAGDGTQNPIDAPTQVNNLHTFTSVAAGASATYALDDDGNLYSWGKDSYGALGNGSPTANVLTPAKVGSKRWAQVSSGASDHACAIDDVGALYCWGRNSSGQWRAGTSSANAPTRVRIEEDPETVLAEADLVFAQVAVSKEHQIVIDQFGDLWAWGNNGRGQLGLGDTAPRTTPTSVTGTDNSAQFGAVDVVSIAASAYNSYAIDSLGHLWAWGDNDDGTVGDGTAEIARTFPVRAASGAFFVNVAGNQSAAYAIDRDGYMYAWGANNLGQQGRGEVGGGTTLAPTKLATESRFLTISTPSASTSSSQQRVWALDSTHRAWGWGAGSAYAWGTGNDDASNRPTAEQFSLPTSVDVVDIAAGSSHSLALTEDYDLFAFGANGQGQLGDGTTAPSTTPKLVDAHYADRLAQVSIGGGFVTALSISGAYLASGKNSAGQLGLEGVANQSTPQVGGNFVQVSAGSDHTLAIDRDGKVWAWGANALGQLGNGNTTQSDEPIQVSIPWVGPGAHAVSVSAGSRFSLALDNFGNVYAWGNNDNFQLGVESPTYRSAAAVVGQATGIVAIAAGESSSFAVTANGDLMAWGNNSSGQLAEPATVAKTAQPQTYTASSPFRQVSAGTDFATAIDDLGRLWGWGGKAGNGTGAQTSTPTLIATGTSRFISVSSWVYSSVAIDTLGNLWQWGDSFKRKAASPTKILSGKNLISADQDRLNIVAVSATGDLYFDGVDQYGDSGRGSTGAVDFTRPIDNWATAVSTASPAYMKDGAKPEFRRVWAGGDTSAALDSYGHLWTWGQGADGQLGNGLYSYASTPQLVPFVGSVTEVDMDAWHIVFSSSLGSVHSFGSGANKNTGRGVRTAIAVIAPSVQSAVGVIAGSGVSGAILETQAGVNRLSTWGVDGTSIIDDADAAWGAGGSGWIATFTEDGQSRASAAQAGHENPWASAIAEAPLADLSSVGTSVLLTQRDGLQDVLVAGIPTYGRTVSAGASEFTRVDAVKFRMAKTGGYHALALDEYGDVWTWGFNSSGQLGRSGGDPTVPERLVVDPPDSLGFIPMSTPFEINTTWSAVSITGVIDYGTLQLNVDTELPLVSVDLTCAGGVIRSSQPLQYSSGTFRYANVDISHLEGCADPTITLVIAGEPVSAAEVNAIVLPLVSTSELPSGW